MANPEIKLVFNAETGKASKNIQDLYNRILNLEKNRGSDFTDKEIRKINDLIETYAKYEHKVVKFNEYVRHINATEFSNEAIRDKTLENTERKFQIILGYGTQIATAMRDIGINPRVLESFVNLASTLSVANKELDVAFANRERLLKQPTAPRGALVTSYPWENGDSPDNPGTPENQFKKRYAAVAADIEAYQKTLNVTIESTERLKAAFREKYAALKETDEGYIQQKQLLESLMVTTDRQLLSLGKLREGVQGQIEDFEQLYKTTSDSKHWLTGLKGIEERISGVAETQQKVDIAAQNSINIQNKYNNAQLKNNDKAIKSEEKYQAALEVTGMTYEELTQLYSQLLAARARAQTPEQIQAIDRQLTAVRKNITLMGREAQISGAQMIGSQTSVLGVMQQVVAQWRNGTLTLKGLTQGIKLFAKSTLVLAAIQFAWEGISWAMEKAKAAIFGTADAEEKAAEQAKALAAAAKTASDNLNSAKEALKGWESDKIREAEAQAYADAIDKQNDKYREQLRLIEEATEADLRRIALNADGKEKEIALEKMRLQREKLAGTISEYDYQKRMIELETKLVDIRGKAKVDAAKVKEADTKKRADEAANLLKESMLKESGFDKFIMSPAQLATVVAQYLSDQATIKKYDEQYKEREALQKDLPQRHKAYKELLDSGQYDAAMSLGFIIKNSEKRLKELNDILHEVDGLDTRSTVSFNSMPEIIREALKTEREQAIKFALEQYSKDYTTAETLDKKIRKDQDEKAKAVEKADRAFIDAATATTNAAQDAANAASFRSKQEAEEMATLNLQQEEKKANKAIQKKIDSATKRVKHMEFNYLQRQEKEMRAWAAQVDEDTPEGKRRRSLSSVYTSAYKARKEAAETASDRVLKQGVSAKGKAAEVVNLAGELAYKSTLDKKVDLDAAISVLNKAIKTKSTTDDAAAVELYNLVQNLMTVAQKNSKDARTLKQKYAALTRKLSDPSR